MIRALLALALLIAPAQAQLAQTGAGGAVGGGAPVYTGPGDVVAGASAFYSCSRAYSASYAAGNGKLCNIVRASDSEACDLLAATTGGPGLTANCTGADNGKTLAVFLASTTGAIVTAYDQSGAAACTGSVACNATQATGASQPAITVSSINSLPAMAPAGSQNMVAANFTSISAPVSVSAVAQSTGTAASAAILGIGTSSTFLSCNCSLGASSTLLTNPGGATGTASQSAWHSIEGDWLASGTPFINVDGVATTGTAGAPAFTNVTLFAGHNLSIAYTGNVTEIGVWSIAFNSTQYAALCKNKQAYYGAGNFGAAC